MGLCNSSLIFQEKKNELFNGLAYVRTYIDDLLIISNKSSEDYIKKKDKVLNRLKSAGFKVSENPFFNKQARIPRFQNN